jgi:hypothetical protein
MSQCSSCGGICKKSGCERVSVIDATDINSDIIKWLRDRSITDERDGSMFQYAATLLHDFKINAKSLLIHCDSMGSGSSIYSLQCLRRLVEKMDQSKP